MSIGSIIDLRDGARLFGSDRLIVKGAVGIACMMFVLAYCTHAQAQDHRHQRLEDAFSNGEMNRQGRGNRGRHHQANDPRVQKFRTIEGSHNNLQHETWGAASVNLFRKAPAAFIDGASQPPRTDMPSAREISNAVCNQTNSIPNARGLSDMVWQWGQFIDHDIDLTETQLPLEPFHILVPSGDTWFDPDATGVQLIFTFRSLYNPHTGTSTPRQQINDITSWIDGSNIYGSDQETVDNLRLFQRGMLRVSGNPTGQLLPVDGEGFFLSGDVRANEQVGLTSMHTLFMREHNRICRQMLRANPNLTDEQLYWNARKRVIATIQAITYNEFIPALLGDNALHPYRGYDPRIFPNIANCFSTAAYRFGHSMLNSTLLRLDNNLNVIPAGNLSLKDAFFNPQEIRDHGIEPYINGLINQSAQEIDSQLVSDVRNFLFGEPGQGGFDLASLNIQRGRDHGLPGINVIRDAYRLPPLRSYAELTTDVELQLVLQDLYGNIDNADPWVVMLCEEHVPGASVGLTAFAILKDQFERLRDGDRFWYQHDFSGSKLEVFENTRLSNIIRRNTTIAPVRSDVFRIVQ